MSQFQDKYGRTIVFTQKGAKDEYVVSGDYDQHLSFLFPCDTPIAKVLYTIESMAPESAIPDEDQ